MMDVDQIGSKYAWRDSLAAHHNQGPMTPHQLHGISVMTDHHRAPPDMEQRCSVGVHGWLGWSPSAECDQWAWPMGRHTWVG